MQVDLNPCFLLHQRAYRETSSILDVFSREHGRVNLIARGVKSKSKNNLQGLLQPCQKIMMSWSGKGELPTLNKVETISPITSTTNKSILLGFYMNELIVKLLHKNEAHSELFDNYEITLQHLEANEQEEKTLRLFEKHLLESIGYGLVLNYDLLNDNAIIPDAKYYYSFENGPSATAPEFGEYIHVQGQTLLSIENECFKTETCLNEAKLLMRYIFKIILGQKPLASRQLYQSYINS